MKHVGLKSLSTFVLTLFLSSTANAIGVTILPGEKLTINFGFDSEPISAIGEIDFFQFAYGGSFTSFYTGERNSYIDVNLYDGEKLLAERRLVRSSSSCCIFVVPGSPGTSLATTDIDMSTIIDGTINGRLEYIPYFGNPSKSSQIELAWRLETGTYIQYGSYWGGSDPIVESYSVSSVPSTVPEPPMLLLLGAAFIGLVGRKHKR